jgi:indoleamine 2,3-dioxygenase
MPGVQRRFLEQIGSHPVSPSSPTDSLGVRQLVIALSASSNSPAAHDVVRKYNAAVTALRRFRDAHLKIACIYIVAQARKAAVEAGIVKEPKKTCPVGAMLRRLAAEGDADLLAVCPISGLNLSDDEQIQLRVPIEPKGPILGTGGTELVTLLRSCRDATTRAMIPVGSR